MAELENNEVEEVVEEAAEEVVEETTDTIEEKETFADRAAKKRAEMKGFKKVMYTFITYIAIVFLDFIDSFRRNPIKIGAWLIAIPGVFIGFLMNYEIDSVYHTADATKAPVFMFILILCGMINIFEAFSITKNKNFGSILIATILSAVIVVSGFIYIIDLVTTINDKDGEFITANYGSFITVGASMILTVVGIVICWIHRDKEYKKDKF